MTTNRLVPNRWMPQRLDHFQVVSLLVLVLVLVVLLLLLLLLFVATKCVSRSFCPWFLFVCRCVLVLLVPRPVWPSPLELGDVTKGVPWGGHNVLPTENVLHSSPLCWISTTSGPRFRGAQGRTRGDAWIGYDRLINAPPLNIWPFDSGIGCQQSQALTNQPIRIFNHITIGDWRTYG